MPTTDRSLRRVLLAPILAALLAAAVAVTPASGATEAQQSAQLLQSVQSGQRTCSSLSTSDFDRIGEYVMRQMLGSDAAHAAMNRQMTATMGSSSETQAHVYMGQRFAGCATGRAPTAFGAMMGMMGAGMMGSASSGGTSTMMGATSGSTGGTMGFGYVTGTRSNGWTSGDTVMVVLMGLLLALAIGALAAWRPWRRRADGTPLETLQARYAHGDIDEQEFDRRRQALGGTA